ncbi:hypothetical protein PHB09_171 [Pseudomonas phage PHB09]|uniref:Uncharacterized protein n=1 Tax=Pseudomonas phage PHB09 TaxID=2867265 RepID=A0AAE8XCE2_9CAUD|nr:hypothetical protein QGX10_gp170 [Pseudomonas phage PHB09]UAV84666.1 hypothetical protein PHB09_171 [Pseudomonas phage PHB09]
MPEGSLACVATDYTLCKMAYAYLGTNRHTGFGHKTYKLSS